MALTGIFNDRHLLRIDRDEIITARYDYQPVYGVPQIDNSLQLATTKFVSEYSSPILGLGKTSGAFSLTENCIYKGTLNGTTTFVLSNPKNINVKNQIKLYLKLATTNLQINWGANNFINNKAPERYTANYIVYYLWNPINGTWSVGSMIEGNIG